MIDKHFPLHENKIDFKSAKNPWITKELVEAIEKKHRIYRKCKSGALPFSKYRSFRNLLNKTLNFARKMYYKNQFICKEINAKTMWSKINKILKPTINKKDIVLKENNRIITNPKKIAKSINTYYNKMPTQIVENEDLSTNLNPTDNIEFNDRTFHMLPVTTNEIIIIISELKDKSFHSAAMPNRILKLIADPLAFHLMKIINLSIETSIFPNILKIARIIPIPKKGKSNDISNFRPISTLNPITKIYEKLLFNRIFNKNNLLCSEQFGFRKG